jgi:hypothetical protein
MFRPENQFFWVLIDSQEYREPMIELLKNSQSKKKRLPESDSLSILPG